MRILCSISTRGRYDTTLPMAIQSVITQTRLPDKLVIFDDNDNPKDTREDPKYRYLFSLLDKKPKTLLDILLTKLSSFIDLSDFFPAKEK